ncbi:tyrosine-protein phosphatase [Microbacterium sp. B19]|uniref:tyrosine-protein phosphatase n=1 Tax=Microbacterium sp. B19 TaxID=96765 RepID=UPI000344C45A|nr:tyrosine-protein phosphatase [Microbacterium sp. B19]
MTDALHEADAVETSPDLSLWQERLRASRVEIPGTTNTRDLGGLPMAGGGIVRPGAVLRGEALAHPGPSVRRVAEWSDAAIESYRALGLRTVIDLRAAEEAALAPSAWAEPTGARLVAVPIDEGGEGDATDYMRRLRAGELRSFGPAELADYYVRTVRARAPRFGRALRVLAEPGATPVLIHCAAGKDRTGMLVALLLEALGVDRDATVADYSMTSIFRPNRVEAYADVLASAGVDASAVSALFDSPAETMRLMLEGVDADYGSVRAFLRREAGVGDDIVERLRAALVTPVAG